MADIHNSPGLYAGKGLGWHTLFGALLTAFQKSNVREKKTNKMRSLNPSTAHGGPFNPLDQQDEGLMTESQEEERKGARSQEVRGSGEGGKRETEGGEKRGREIGKREKVGRRASG